MQRWTEDFCNADTDEDGKTNGEELGDPNCVWVEEGTPARTTDITHPGTYHKITKHHVYLCMNRLNHFRDNHHYYL